MNMACYLVNRSPVIPIGLTLPQEVYSGRPLEFFGLRVFGCPAYYLVESHKRTKLEAKSKKSIFIGYQEGTKGYKLWDPTEKKVVISRNVTFDESELMKSVDQEAAKDESQVEIEVQIKGQPGEDPQVDEDVSDDSSEDGDLYEEEPQQIE